MATEHPVSYTHLDVYKRQGLYNRIEVWDEDKWDKYNKENTDRIDDVAEGLKEFEI